MGLEENKALMRRWLDEGWCKGNVDVADELLAGDFKVHGAGGQVLQSGRQAIKELVQAWRQGFPDGRMQVLDEIAEGELVGVRLLWTGTHLGRFNGVAPSGRTVSCISLGIDRIRDGRIVEGWGELDMLGLMQRLGGLPRAAPSVPFDADLEEPTRPSPASSPVAANKAAVRRFLQALEDREPDAARNECDVDSYVEHVSAWGTVFLEEAFWADSQLRASLPDISFVLDEERTAGEGDRVIVRGMFTGTHTGAPLFGVRASGKTLAWGGIDIFRVTEGRLAERWRCSDTLSLMQQAGAAAANG